MQKSIIYNIAKSITAALLLFSLMTTSGCSTFGVYQIDLPQGTPITQPQAQKIQVGMSQSQVLYYLGTPALRDTLEPNRWDYLYDFVSGTTSERDGVKAIQNASQHFIVYFDDKGLVSKVEGLDSLPKSK